MSAKNKTQVIIAGKIYTLSCYDSEEYLQRVAAYLNGKISEFKSMEGYSRLSPDLRNIMLNLNMADDYFKMKKKIEDLERELMAKDKEVYDFKHELITAQIKLENAEKDVQTLEEKNIQLQKENIQMETQLKNTNRR